MQAGPGVPMSAAARAALAGLFIMACVMGIGRFVYTPILALMIADGTLNASQAGIVAGANFLGYLVGALAASAKLFQRRQRLWMVCGVVLSVATTGAMAVDTHLATMLLLRFLSGLASAFGMIFITALVLARLVADGRPGLFAYHFGGVGLGIAASAVLVARLAASGVSWQECWAWSALAAAACAIAGALLLPRHDPMVSVLRSGGADGQSFGLPLAILTVSYGLFGFGYVITATFINAMARSVPQLQPVEPWVWMVVGLSGLPSLLLWNRFAGLAGLSAAYALACLVEGAGVMLSVLVQTPAALIASAIMLGGTFMAISALGFGLARTLKGGSNARAIALMTAAFGCGQMAGPVVAGFLFDKSGDLYAASLLAGAAMVIASALTLVAHVAGKRGGATAA
jgi:predicted MFS family arabinose efflux permease